MPWQNAHGLNPKQYTCGHCGNLVASAVGFASNQHGYIIYLCPSCDQPTYFSPGAAMPGVPFGSPVLHLPADVEALYSEARRCAAMSAYTAAVLLCRKLLMNISVSLGAKPGLKFVEYVEYLANAGYVPPNGKTWVDHIRNRGNEATHEISLMEANDAQDLIQFSEMLLKFIYEFPMKVPTRP